MFKTILKSKFSLWIVFLYLIVVIWSVIIQTQEALNTDQSYLFNWFYGLIALSGAVYGIRIANKNWGGINSVLGRGLIFLSLGLLGQWFGLQVWTYYNVIARVEVPYPSLADLGYFALIPFYALAAVMFAQASGAKFSLRTNGGKLWALLIPVIALVISTLLFIKDVGFDLSDPLKLFLDIGYPLGEIIPVSIAVFTLTLSRNLLGGTMKKKVLYLIGAFFFQFLTEYAFLYAAGMETYQNGAWNDMMYATSYAIMGLGLTAFRSYE